LPDEEEFKMQGDGQFSRRKVLLAAAAVIKQKVGPWEDFDATAV